MTKNTYVVYDENKEEIGRMTGIKEYNIAKKAATRYAKEATKDKPMTIFIRKTHTKSFKQYEIYTEKVKNEYVTEWLGDMINKAVVKYIPKSCYTTRNSSGIPKNLTKGKKA